MIDKDVEEFLQLSLRSVWTLEVLLLLLRQPARGWTERTLLREMRASQTVVSEAVATLTALGLIATDENGEIRYRAASPLHALAERVSALYRERPAAVTLAIHAKGTSNIQTFADSFKLRKD